MEKREAREYQVEFTPSSRYYFYEVLEYLYKYYPTDRAEQLADELEGTALSLKYHPHRGIKEKWLSGLKQDYRFILFYRTTRADIKIIYYIKEEKETYAYLLETTFDHAFFIVAWRLIYRQADIRFT